MLQDLKEAIVKGLGFQTGDFKILSFDLRDTLLPIFNKKKGWRFKLVQNIKDM